MLPQPWWPVLCLSSLPATPNSQPPTPQRFSPITSTAREGARPRRAAGAGDGSACPFETYALTSASARSAEDGPAVGRPMHRNLFRRSQLRLCSADFPAGAGNNPATPRVAGRKASEDRPSGGNIRRQKVLEKSARPMAGSGCPASRAPQGEMAHRLFPENHHLRGASDLRGRPGPGLLVRPFLSKVGWSQG